MKKTIAILMVLMIAFAAFAGGASEASKPAAASESKEGGILKISVAGDASSLLAYKLRGGTDRAYGCVIFEKLLNLDGNGNPYPYLLESYEQDPEGKTYTLHIKKGIKFHDGSVLNADVVKWNLDIYKEKGAQNKSFLGNLNRVEVVDEYTVKMILDNWDALIPFYMAREGGCGYVMSKEAYEKNGEDWCKENFVSTGPFKCVKWNHDSGLILERFDDYWQGRPYLDGVELNIYRDNATIEAAFLTGDVQAVMMTNSEVADYLGPQGFNITVAGIPSNAQTVAFESAKTTDPFHDIRVRQAACYALDTVAITKAMWGDYGEPATQYAKTGATYWSDKIDGYQYNPEKAKALLAEAGYPNGFNTTIIVNSQGGTGQILAQILIEQWAQVGIKVEMKLLDNAAYSILVDGWDGGMFLHGMGMDAGVPAQIAGSYADGLTSGIGLKSFDRPANLGPTIAAGCASDAEGVIKYFKEAQEIIFQDNVLLKAIAVTFPIAVTSPKLHDDGIGATASSSADLWDAWLEK